MSPMPSPCTAKNLNQNRTMIRPWANNMFYLTIRKHGRPKRARDSPIQPNFDIPSSILHVVKSLRHKRTPRLMNKYYAALSNCNLFDLGFEVVAIFIIHWWRSSVQDWVYAWVTVKPKHCITNLHSSKIMIYCEKPYVGNFQGKFGGLSEQFRA